MIAVKLRRMAYNLKRRARLRCRPSVISRNCVGGVLCHDLRLRFLSPTINISMPEEDFILFCRHLSAFLAVKMEEVAEHDKNYPVGRLNTEFGTVTLWLVHYATFQDGAQAWERRKKRVDMDNLRIIFHLAPNPSESLLEQFEQLPFAHKLLLSSGMDQAKYPHCYNLSCYEGGFRGDITQYISDTGITRYQDEYDWIPFLNGNT